MNNTINIPIKICEKEIVLTISGEASNKETIFEVLDALENGEAPFQLKEGCFYEYKITEGFDLEPSEIVSQSKVNVSSGRISPNIYVGTLSIGVRDKEKNEICAEIKLEVQSVKTNYRNDYRFMLEEITEKCTDLLMLHSSLVSQNFEPEYFKDPVTAYQRFAFIKSIIDSVEFNDAVHKILSAPVTKWQEIEKQKDVRGLKRLNNSAIRQILSGTNRSEIPDNHPLKHLISSIPLKINISCKSESVDTPENRFVKHALISFLRFIRDFRIKLLDSSRLKLEVTLLEDKLEQFVNHAVFKEVALPNILPLNSPILQRKEGYREILRIWLMFDLAAKLVWHGGDDVYSGGKRDVAVLYEYWLFFKLIDLIKEVFNIEPKSIKELIKETKDGLCLQLRQGQYFPVKGVFDAGSRKLEIQFSYNKTFSGDKDYPESGSWTKSMRPDYTLSIWPFGIDAETAEKQELITHIHFDSKYKVDHLVEILGSDEDFKNEKADQRKGTYKRADLLKMHAYKDAIRRTSGAYILYPGNDRIYTKTGFHEIIPGLGAFAIRPSKQNNGSEDLRKFLIQVIDHFINRASQREKMSLNTYETHKDNKSNELKELLPEAYGANRSLLPDESFVLVGFYKDAEHLVWITNHKLYNARTGSTRGSLRLSPKETGAKYILLHTSGETKTGRLFKLKKSGPRIFSKQDMITRSYINPTRDFYLVYEVEEEIEQEFEGMNWDITLLEGFKSSRGSALPFAVSLTQLMKTIVKQ
jgi:hypothetical protein